MLRLGFDFSIQDDIKAVLEHALTNSLNSVLGGYIFAIIETVQFSKKTTKQLHLREGRWTLPKCDF